MSDNDIIIIFRIFIIIIKTKKFEKIFSLKIVIFISSNVYIHILYIIIIKFRRKREKNTKNKALIFILDSNL